MRYVDRSAVRRLGHNARSLDEPPAGGKQPTSESFAASPACAKDVEEG